VALRCQIPGEEYETRPFGEFDLGAVEMAKYFGDAIDPAFDTFPRDLSLSDDEFERQLSDWNVDFVTRLRDVGRRLWTLLPKAFCDEYLRLTSLPYPPRSICVHSDEMIFPWEIIRPAASSANGTSSCAPGDRARPGPMEDGARVAAAAPGAGVRAGHPHSAIRGRRQLVGAEEEREALLKLCAPSP
jgi:hypothetical protein